MNKRIKTDIGQKNGVVKMVAGVVAGMIIGGATIGVASNNYVQALLNQEIKVSLDGIVQTFKDETTGKVQYPLTYHDRTYLPLRNVAQLSGLEVDYDNETNTAILKNKYNKELPDGPIINKKFEAGKNFSTGDYLTVDNDVFNIKTNYLANKISTNIAPIGTYAVDYPKGYYNGNYYKYEWNVEDETIVTINEYTKYEPIVQFDAKNVGTTNIILTVTTADGKETVTKSILVNVTEK